MQVNYLKLLQVNYLKLLHLAGKPTCTPVDYLTLLATTLHFCRLLGPLEDHTCAPEAFCRLPCTPADLLLCFLAVYLALMKTYYLAFLQSTLLPCRLLPCTLVVYLALL